jgi:hypothetical protein
LIARLKAREEALQELLLAAAKGENLSAAVSALRDLVKMGKAVAKVRRRTKRAA